MKTKLLFLLAAVMCVVACSKNDCGNDSLSAGEWLDDATGNYMDAFITPDSLGLSFVKGEDGIASKILVDLSNDFIHRRNCDMYCYNSKSEADLIRYKKYAKYYCDTTYYHGHPIECNVVGCSAPLVGVSIVADRELDENHPEGTVLNDLFPISYSRFYQYI